MGACQSEKPARKPAHQDQSRINIKVPEEEEEHGHTRGTTPKRNAAGTNNAAGHHGAHDHGTRRVSPRHQWSSITLFHSLNQPSTPITYQYHNANRNSTLENWPEGLSHGQAHRSYHCQDQHVSSSASACLWHFQVARNSLSQRYAPDLRNGVWVCQL